MKETKEKTALVMDRTTKKPKIPRAVMSDLLWCLYGFFAAGAILVPHVAPFGVAYLATERRFTKRNIAKCMFVILGYAVFLHRAALGYIAACLVYEAVLYCTDRGEEVSLSGAVWTVSLGMVSVHLMTFLWQGVTGSALFRMVMDFICIMIGVRLFEIRQIMGKEKVRGFKFGERTEEIFYLTMIGIFLLSFKVIPPFRWLSVSNILAFGILGCIAAFGGVFYGAAVGMMIGVLFGIQEELYTYLVIFVICGWMGGLGGRIHPNLAAVGIAVCGAMLSIYGMMNHQTAVGVLDPILGACLVYFMPKKMIRKIQMWISVHRAKEDKGCINQEWITAQFARTADSFETLSKTMMQLSDEREQETWQEFVRFLSTLSERVCRDCGRYTYCWNQQFQSTYQDIVLWVETMEKKGTEEAETVQGKVLTQCMHSRAFWREIKSLYEMYQINGVWIKKLAENRELVSQQFHGAAEILRRAVQESREIPRADEAAAKEIEYQLIKRGYQTEKVMVSAQADQRKRVQIVPLFDQEISEKEVCEILYNIYQVRFMKECDLKKGDDPRKDHHYIEAPRIKIEGAVSIMKKGEESGDAYLLYTLRGGKYLATLSDGMGTGSKAHRESSAVIGLIEDFMEAGFDKKVAVRLINSAMVMKSAGEFFSTVDMCMVDLYTGEAEFIKNGAEASYIKRSEYTEVVRSASLPIGILSGVEAERFAHTLHPGDVVVMVSDGIAVKEESENCVKALIESAPKEMPIQELSDAIIDQSVKRRGGKIEDDMTVLVLRVYAA